jgi:hypothetical protein
LISKIYLHYISSHLEINPYIALFQELNQGEWSIPKQRHFGLLGQGQDGRDVETSNNVMAIDMQDQEAEDCASHQLSPSREDFHIQP